MSLPVVVALFVGVAFLIGALLGWVYYHSRGAETRKDVSKSARTAVVVASEQVAIPAVAQESVLPDRNPILVPNPTLPAISGVDLAHSASVPGIVLGQYRPLVRFAEHRPAFVKILERVQTTPEAHLDNALAVLAPHRAAGATTIAAGLALTLASGMEGRHDPAPVLLIDFHLENPSLDRLFGIRSSSGLTDYLAGKELSAAYFHRIGSYPLWVLPAGRRLQEALFNPQAIDRLRVLLGEMKLRFRWVLLDVGSSPTGAHWLEGVRAAALCVAQRARTRRSEILAVRRFLETHGLPLVGVVLNRMRSQAA
jgi:Mrp family chromosome partitioning ATPase|nr:MAG: hypothetical protein KatS3mg041_1530 [Bacteroidota bacterium]